MRAARTGYNRRLYCVMSAQAYNRRYFEIEIEKGLVSRYCHDRPGRLLSYIMIFRHNAGDVALTVVAGVIMKHIRKTDIRVNYGGDEFILIIEFLAEEEFFSQ